MINGSKMWITNARHAGLYLVLAKTDASAQPAHKGMGAFVVDSRTPGLTVGRDIDKLGYRGLETCEVHFDQVRVPAADLVGGVEGHGFHQVMTGLETERITSRHARSGSPAPRSTKRSATRSGASRSGSRSPSIRRFS